MTTVINNPGENSGDGTSSGAGVVIGAVLVIIVLIVVVFLSLPYIRQQIEKVSNRESPTINPTINVQLPNPTAPATTN